jgi:two-component system response regulator CpxR
LNNYFELYQTKLQKNLTLCYFDSIIIYINISEMNDNSKPQIAPALNQSPANESKRKYKILVVDDEADARTLFLDILSMEEQLEVSTAADGVDALAKSEATKFDIILLDIVMPNKDGVQTLTELVADKEKYGTPRITMLTNIGGDLAVEESLKLGAVGYKTKIDTEPSELLKFVREEISKIEDGLPSNVVSRARMEEQDKAA